MRKSHRPESGSLALEAGERFSSPHPRLSHPPRQEFPWIADMMECLHSDDDDGVTIFIALSTTNFYGIICIL